MQLTGEMTRRRLTVNGPESDELAYKHEDEQHPAASPQEQPVVPHRSHWPWEMEHRAAEFGKQTNNNIRMMRFAGFHRFERR